MIKKLLAALFLASACFADQVAVNQFKGLNNNEASVVIGPEMAQDILNVDVTPGGKSIKKRPGYGLYKTLTTSQGLHGIYHFFDATGNDVIVAGSSTSLWGIVSDGTPTQLLSSATLNTTWDCADIQGSAYCVDSSRDAIIKTAGATINWYTTPLGTMVEATPDRLAIGGVAAAPSSIYLSASNSFTNFTAAPLTTDPFIEPIAAPGSKLTHLRYACGKLLWWKDQSFGSFDFNDQYAAEVKIISDNIGTFDNTSAVDPGGSVWFRGQDGHIWQYDCAGLLKQSIEITPLVQASGHRVSNSWNQSSQSDLQAGASIPTPNLSFTISPGDVTVSSFTAVEDTTAEWALGTSSNISIGTSSLSVTMNNNNIVNNGFESGGTGWSADISDASESGDSCTISPRTGSKFGRKTCVSCGIGTQSVNAWDCDTLATLASGNWNSASNSCTWTSRTMSMAGLSGRLVKIAIYDGFITTVSDCFISNGQTITFYTASDIQGGISVITAYDDFTDGRNTISKGVFTSQTFDVGVTSAIYKIDPIYSTYSSTPSFALFTATATNGNWITTLTSTGTNAWGNRYAKYSSTISISITTDTARTAISTFTVLARSSGTYYSAWKNAPNLSAWSIFSPTYSNNDGSHSFFVRSSTSPQSVLNSTVTWVAQTAGALVTASTGTYFQMRDDFSITAATQTPILNDFTFSWFDGNATDQAYMLYFDNAIWADVSYGTGVSSNTYIFRRDLINDGWTLYNFGAGGMAVQNAHLFFGDVAATGKLFQYGSGTSDNGNSIISLWKSKDFTGPDPFLQSQLNTAETFARRNANQSITATYSLDTSTTTTSFTIGLSSATSSIVQSRKNLPSGKLGYTFNLSYGDTSSTSAWEILGYRLGFIQLPWRPTN